MKIRLALALLIVACTTVPGTGRSQLNFLPLSTEMNLGAQAWGETLANEQLITSGAQYQMIQRVGERVAAAAVELYPDPASQFAWEFVLIDNDETVNAWALSGGKSAVYTGLLPITQDEDGLAVVMGHEVAHAIARHGAERMSQGLVFELGLTVASKSTGGMSPEQHDQLMQALVGVGQLGVLLPYSRHHESEADHIGLFLSATAGYDPRASVELWTRMAEASAGSGKPPEFFSTHPSEATRIEQLEAIMPEALRLYELSDHR